MCICGSQGRMSRVFLFCSSPHSLKQVLTLNTNLAFSAGSAEQGALGIHCPRPPPLGFSAHVPGLAEDSDSDPHACTLDKCSDPLTHPPLLGVQSFWTMSTQAESARAWQDGFCLRLHSWEAETGELLKASVAYRERLTWGWGSTHHVLAIGTGRQPL